MSEFIQTQLRILRTKRLARDAAKERYEVLEAEFKALQREVLENMENEGIQSLKADDVLFVPTATVYANVQDREAFEKWAEDNDESLLELKPRKAVLNELVREKLDNGEELPPGISFYTREYIAQRSG